MNSVILVGRLSRDPEVRYTPSQLAVARFTVAVSRPPSRNAQENQPTADFIDVTAFGKTAELLERYFSKGKWIGVQGRIQNDNYTNKDGVKVYRNTIFADRIDFVGNKGEDGGYSNGNYGGGYPSNGYPAGGTGYGNSGNGGGYPNGGDFRGNGGDYQQPQQSGQGAGPEPGFQVLEDDDVPF